MDRIKLVNEIRARSTYLCVGLDSDLRKLPRHLLGLPDPIFAFNKAIIDATRDLCIGYKINTAFYEAEGLKGWESLERTVHYIGDAHFRIADAKRGDIGNTSSMYARAFFEQMPFDAITVAPYMGEDSIRPFLEYKNKWTIVLGLTSNPGSRDVELLNLEGGQPVYEAVMQKVSSWGSENNLMFVVGATQEEEFGRIRQLFPNHFFLVPGIGAQGGSLQSVSREAMNADVGLLVNASRAVIFASAGEDFADKAREAALKYRDEMSAYL